MQVNVRISNPEQPEHAAEQVSALIDTGASYSSVPRAVVDRLALVALPAGKTYATLEYAGCKAACELSISDSARALTISLATLTALGLEFDLFTGILKPVASTS